MTASSVQSAGPVKKSPVLVVLPTQAQLDLGVKKSQAAETLVLSQAKQFVNKETHSKAKPEDFLQRCCNKSRWACSNNRTSRNDNSRLNKACHQTKWGNSHQIRECHQTK